MATADNELVYLENANALKDWMEPVANRSKIGALAQNTKNSAFVPPTTRLPYAGPDGIQAMLEGLMRFGWQGKYEGDVLVGLSRPAKPVAAR